jgi:hypothetical protein
VSSNVKLLVGAELLVSEDYARDLLISPVRDLFVTYSGSLTNNASLRNKKGPPQSTSGICSVR